MWAVVALGKMPLVIKGGVLYNVLKRVRYAVDGNAWRGFQGQDGFLGLAGQQVLMV